MVKMIGNRSVILLVLVVLAHAGRTLSQTCTPSYSKAAGVTAAGGTPVLGATTVDSCQGACQAASTCTGFSFNSATASCATYTSPQNNVLVEPNADLYEKKWQCGDCVYAVYHDKKSPFQLQGTVFTKPTADACAVACSNDDNCRSVDFDSFFTSSNCVFFTAAQDVDFFDLISTTGFVHMAKEFCTTPEPCVGPPVECTVTPGPCSFPPGKTCGSGTTEQVWQCTVGGEVQEYPRTRLCCVKCPVITPCDTLSNQDCIVGNNPTTADDCWDEDCCWVPGTPNQCLKPGLPPVTECSEVWPACDTP